MLPSHFQQIKILNMNVSIVFSTYSKLFAKVCHTWYFCVAFEDLLSNLSEGIWHVQCQFPWRLWMIWMKLTSKKHNEALDVQITKFMGPTWGPPGSCRPQMGPMLAPWTLLSGRLHSSWHIQNIKGLGWMNQHVTVKLNWFVHKTHNHVSFVILKCQFLYHSSNDGKPICLTMSWQQMQRSFCVCAQPMRDDVT